MTPEEIEKQALERLRDGIEDFHLLLSALADFKEKDPEAFQDAINFLIM